MRAARDAGVRIDAGTDGMVSDADSSAPPNIHAELELRADPTADIRNTWQIAFVVRRGRIVTP